MTRPVLALVAMLLAPVAALADDVLPTGTAPPPPVNVALGADVPGRMTVPVTIGTHGPYQFIIDTGAERTVISRQLADALHLQTGPTVRVMAMAGAADVATVVIPALTVSATGTSRIEAPALDANDLGAAGLLGIDTLQHHAVSIDITHQRMSVRPSERRRPRPAEPGEIVVQAKGLLGQLVVTDAFYHGQRVRVVIDTGSAVSMGNLALKAAVARRMGATQPVSLISVTGRSLQADYTQVPAVQLGTMTINNLPIAFADAAPFRRLGLESRPALMLGMDAMKLFRRVDIDFANREVRFQMTQDARL
ncbi:MAG: aspartyl protease family protein [Sphingomonas sp.]